MMKGLQGGPFVTDVSCQSKLGGAQLMRRGHQKDD